MKEFLAFLQIIQLIGKCIVSLIRNYHITSALILFFDIIDRLGSPQKRPVEGWEVLLSSLVVIWYYRKRSARKTLEPITPIININNKNIVGIINSDTLKNDNDK